MSDRPNAPILNSLPKYMAAQSLTPAARDPTTILSEDVPARVAALPRQPGREIQIHGSARLARSSSPPDSSTSCGS